jgi:carbon-monoxide dehydrogenase medium subunit
MVRNMGTLGGSVANNDPSADYPSAVLALDATVQTSRRRIAADDFFLGMFETALEPGEIITAIEFSIPRRAAYMKFKNPASRYAVVGVFVADCIEFDLPFRCCLFRGCLCRLLFFLTVLCGFGT